VIRGGGEPAKKETGLPKLLTEEEEEEGGRGPGGKVSTPCGVGGEKNRGDSLKGGGRRAYDGKTDGPVYKKRDKPRTNRAGDISKAAVRKEGGRVLRELGKTFRARGLATRRTQGTGRTFRERNFGGEKRKEGGGDPGIGYQRK